MDKLRHYFLNSEIVTKKLIRKKKVPDADSDESKEIQDQKHTLGVDTDKEVISSKRAENGDWMDQKNFY